MNPFDYANSAALVTGASRGIGAALTRLLADRGIATLILVARTTNDLEDLAREIRTTQQDHTRVEVVAADLSQADAPAQIKAETDRRGLSVDLLVNNAGFGSHGSFDTLDAEKEAGMVAVNIAALVALTRLYLPDMVARGSGGVINVASTAGFQPVPYMTTYGATKAFVLSFSEALWAENADRENEVRIVCLCPGATETNFGAATGGERGKFESVPADTPELVARVGLNALDQNKAVAIVGAANYALAQSARFAPRALVARSAAAMMRPLDSSDKGNDTSLRRTAILTGAGSGKSCGPRTFDRAATWLTFCDDAVCVASGLSRRLGTGTFRCARRRTRRRYGSPDDCDAAGRDGRHGTPRPPRALPV